MEHVLKISKLYNRIYPKIDQVRGATRLKIFLEDLRLRGYPKAKTSDPVWEEEWDNLLILDACRADTYEDLTGVRSSRFSVASCSPDFISETFSHGDWSDTVVITANPYYHPSHFNDLTGRTLDQFADAFLAFRSPDQKYGTGDWDSDEGTVLAEDMVKRAETAEKLYPDKRKIVHFMQPHFPFVGNEVGNTGFLDNADEGEIVRGIWPRVIAGEVDPSEAIEGYRKNLEYVYPKAKELGEKLSGKTYITSDHGNFLGEADMWDHPCAHSHKVLREVPWHQIE